MIGLISCTTTDNTEATFDTTPIFINMIPSPPDIPKLPKLNWSFENDRYFLDEEDVDKLINFGEYELPFYRVEMDIFNKQLLIIKDSIMN